MNFFVCFYYLLKHLSEMLLQKEEGQEEMETLDCFLLFLFHAWAWKSNLVHCSAHLSEDKEARFALLSITLLRKG